jgi:hypothetical protein
MPAGITLTELCLYEILVSVFIIAQRGCNLLRRLRQGLFIDELTKVQ